MVQLNRKIIIAFLLVVAVGGFGIWLWNSGAYHFQERKTESVVVKPGSENAKEGEVSLGYGYYRKDNIIIWRSGEYDIPQQEFTITNADINSFEVLNRYYAKDDNKAYINGKPIPESAGKTFTHIADFYSKDKRSVYYGGKRIVDADPQTFEFLNSQYQKDKNYAYFEGTKIEGGDGISFEVIDSDFAKDKNATYSLGKKISEDIAMRTPLGEFHEKDRNFVYYVPYHGHEGNKIEGADPATFEVLDMFFGKDKNAVYYDYSVVPGADASSFEELDFSYGKDVYAVYMGTAKIGRANPKTFVPLTADYSKDKDSVFYKWDKIDSADPQTFRAEGHMGRARDKNNLYEHGKIVESFE
jgi:hypothetical protein